MIRTLVSVCVFGALVGLFFGFVLMVVGGGAQFAPGPVLLVWLKRPDFYWPWPVFGAVLAGLGFSIFRRN